jgi:hypothetical protein
MYHILALWKVKCVGCLYKVKAILVMGVMQTEVFVMADMHLTKIRLMGYGVLC